jgi:hypothetical protein
VGTGGHAGRSRARSLPCHVPCPRDEVTPEVHRGPFRLNAHDAGPGDVDVMPTASFTYSQYHGWYTQRLPRTGYRSRCLEGAWRISSAGALTCHFLPH